MNRKLSLLLSVAVLTMATGCGSKKLAQPKAEYFTLNPAPLEVVASQVPGNAVGKLPGNYFVKSAELIVTPVLSYNGKEVKGESSVFQGEKVRGNNPVVNFEYGGTINVPMSFVYEPGMEQADVVLNFQGRNGSRTYALAPVTIGHGVLTTSSLATPEGITPSIAADKFQKVVQQKYDANIMFLVNQANVRDSEIGSKAMAEFNRNVREAAADSTRRIDEINISSYASPEGSLDFNEKLAQKREKSTSDYLTRQMSRDNITDIGQMTAQFTAEDWEGFRKLVAESNIQDKDLILSVLEMYKDPEQREREIRNLSSVFDQIKDQILPKLRYSRLTATVSVIGKSDAELRDLYASNPSSLSVDEILYLATLTDNASQRKQIYNTAASLYPNDYRTYNNLGAMQLAEGDVDGARANFAQATRLNPANPEAKANEAILAMMSGNYNEANTLLGSAAGADNLGDALGTYNLLQGNTSAAASAFGDTKSNNAAVAQILAKDYVKAKQTLSGITSPDATTYYLMAIVGARTNNDNMVRTNLRQAVKLNPELGRRAATDIEFVNYNLSGVI